MRIESDACEVGRAKNDQRGYKKVARQVPGTCRLPIEGIRRMVSKNVSLRLLPKVYIFRKKQSF